MFRRLLLHGRTSERPLLHISHFKSWRAFGYSIRASAIKRVSTWARWRIAVCAAHIYRRQLRGITFIGVTGSCGKTTTAAFAAAILGSRFKGRYNRDNRNLLPGIAQTILELRPWHDYCVLEIAAAIRGNRLSVERAVRLAMPRIGVVTTIGTDHIAAFGSIEAIAREKARLIEALPAHGIAILNADDPRVLAMQERCAARVVTYGLSADAMVRAVNVRCSWPERLSFTIHYAGSSHDVRTELCGAFWVHCMLAAAAVGLAMGLPLAAVAAGIQSVPPVDRRMSPVPLTSGVTFIRDDLKSPLGSVGPALAFMADARARRKIVVFGTLSDYVGNSDRKYIAVARQALAVADHVVFTGPCASKCLPAKRGSPNNMLHAYYSVDAAQEYLQQMLEPGDLVLLKGGSRDDLSRLIPKPGIHAAYGSARVRTENTSIAGDRSVRVVVGLGNPGQKYEDTPHSIGRRVVGRLANLLGAVWTRSEEELVACIESDGAVVYLVKLSSMLNNSGPVLAALANRLGFSAADCVLIHDDIDLPMGVVRFAEHGGDAGHRGVRSVLDAFRTDGMRRVKVGVRRAGHAERAGGHLNMKFQPGDVPAIEEGCELAVRRTLDIIGFGNAELGQTVPSQPDA